MDRRVIISVMPDYGMGPYAWLRDPVRDGHCRGVGGNIADRYGWGFERPISIALHADFAAWVARFERHCPWGTAAEELPAFDWGGFHRHGLQLATRLKTELGSDVRVRYVSPAEDPDKDLRAAVEIGPRGPVFHSRLLPAHRPSRLLVRLLRSLRRRARICPEPEVWNGLYPTLTPCRIDGRFEPPPPLTVSVWADTPAVLKAIRFREHLECADAKGLLDQVAATLAALPEARWLHVGEYADLRSDWLRLETGFDRYRLTA